MRKSILLMLTIIISNVSCGQRTETVYLNEKDITLNMYIAVFPKNEIVKSFMVLLDGFGNSPEGVLSQTDIPKFASKNGVLTIIPLLKTGTTYWGSDNDSQQSLKKIISLIVSEYQLKDKDFFIGGFGIGGTCAVKYAELAVQEIYEIKPKVVFTINQILDWERYYNGAKAVGMDGGGSLFLYSYSSNRSYNESDVINLKNIGDWIDTRKLYINTAVLIGGIAE